MPVNFIISGQKTYIEKITPGIVSEVLKSKLYSLEFSKDEGFYLLDIADKYTLPEKTYGKNEELAKRIIKTHHSRRGNTGILLTGLKGTGKTLLVKFIANKMIDLGIPVIQINKAYHGEAIFNFIESIGECVLIFDEFGKNYVNNSYQGSPNQVGLLSLLDGLGNSKRLHLFTENDVLLISEYLINRPGRIHYHFKYNRLSDEIIKEYCTDHSIPQSVIEELLNLSSKIKVLSFDIVSCLINEWKLYGGNITDHLNFLNISLCRDPDNENVRVISFIRDNGKEVNIKDISVTFRDNYIEINIKNDKDKYSSREYLESLKIEDAISVKDNVYKFINNIGDKIELAIDKVRY